MCPLLRQRERASLFLESEHAHGDPAVPSLALSFTLAEGPVPEPARSLRYLPLLSPFPKYGWPNAEERG